MNPMLKKASSVCAALVCAASLMVSGTSFVMAADDLDDAAAEQIASIAEGLTDMIIPLSEDEIAAYLETGDEFTVNAINAWDSAKDEVGELIETGETAVEYSGEQYTAVVPVQFEKEDAEFTYVFEDANGTLTPTSLSVDIQYSLGTILTNAALNTLMGLGTVFVVLVLLIFIISLFKFIPGSPATKKREEKTEAPVPAPAAPAPAPAAVPAYDDKELVAVITAAIAASEGTSPDGFVVRSIRKINRKKR